MDPLQWMGAVRVQTADKNITHMALVHHLMSGEVKSCMFGMNEFIIKMLALNYHFLT